MKTENQNRTKCKSCGEQILLSEGIMTTLEGAYHKDIPECQIQGLILAPAPKTLAGIS